MTYQTARHRYLTTRNHRRYRLGLEHYSRHILPRRLGQEYDWAGLDDASLKELVLALASYGDEDDPQADLMAYADFTAFNKTNELGRLESAIAYQQEALILARKNENLCAADEALHNLVCFKARKFEATGLAEDMRAAISAAEEAEGSTPVLHPDKHSRAAELFKLRVYESKMVRPAPAVPVEVADETDALKTIIRDSDIIKMLLEGDISPLVQRLEAVLSSPIAHGPERLRLADALGLMKLVHCGAALAANKESSSWDEDTIETFELVRFEFLAAHVRPRRIYLDALAMALCRKSLTPDGTDVGLMERARIVLQEIIEVAENLGDSLVDVLASHPVIVGLAAELGERLDDNVAAILESIEGFNPSRLYYVGILGALMQRRYKALHNPDDLEEAVRLLEEHWRGSVEKDADSLTSAVLLVKCYMSLFRLPAHKVDNSFLSKSAALADELLSHPLLPSLREQLLILRCDCYSIQWHYTGDTSLLDPAIKLAESLRAQISYDRGDGPALLHTLMDLYLERSELLLRSNDLDKAFGVAMEALDMADSLTANLETTSVDVRISRARALNELGKCFVMRHRSTRDTTFLEEAVRLATRAVEESRPLDDHDPNKLHHPWRLANLRSQLFRRNGDGKQLTESIEWCRGAIEDASADPNSQRGLQQSLSEYLGMRYLSDPKRHEGDAVESMDIARKLLAESDPLYCARLFILIYRKNREEAILDEAIDLAKLALPSHEEMSEEIRLFGTRQGQAPAEWVFGELSVAEMILERMHRRGETWSDDAELALKCLLRCSRATSQDSVVTIRAAIFLSDPIFTSSTRLDIADLAFATRKAVHLLPHVLSRALKREDIQQLLGLCAGLPTAAAASAVATGRGATEALELLEAGRGILTTYHLDTRADVWDLDGANNELVALLKQKLAHLEIVNASRGEDEIKPTGHKWQVDKAYELNKEVESILDRLGSQGRESLLQLPKPAEIRGVVPKGRQGAVAVINVHFRCDAILIHNGTIETIPLPRLTMKSAREATKCLEFIQKRFPPPHIQEWLWNLVLLWLWEVAVRPVLDYLGYTAPPSKPDEWPRVWWVPTGEVSQLPFHAAGIHRRGSSSSALDRVVSSYSSSVKALLYTQSIVLDHKKRHDDGGNSAKTRVVIASMSTTPAHRSLAFVQDEVRAVKEKAGSSATINELPQPLKQQVIKGLKSCDVFHFAGHGASYIDDPDRGCLLLEDWETEPLAVKDILGLRLHKHVPFLAYLSACSTGANRTASLSDEVIHLVTAFQLAGFQHVIGSFWAVSDYASREVAGDFYARLGGRFGRDVDVALALHLAVRQLRVAPSRPGLRSTDEVEPDAEHILACDASRADEDRAQGPEIDSFLAELGNSRSLGFSEEDWSDVRDPRPGSVRRPMAKVHAMRNPVLWAPYFHTGF